MFSTGFALSSKSFMHSRVRKHLATCGFCWRACAELYHRIIPYENSKSARLQCFYCARTVYSSSSAWLVLPCGWWENNICFCDCMYMDMLGNLIEDHIPIFTTDMWLMENVRDIEIESIHGHRIVNFSSMRRIKDGNGGHTEESYSDDEHQPLHICQAVCRKPFQQMLPFIKFF